MVSLITEKLKQQSLDDAAGEPTGWRRSPPHRRSSLEHGFAPGSEAQSAPSSFAFAKSKTSPGFGQSFDQMSSPPRAQGPLPGGAYGPETSLPSSPPFIPKKRHCRSMNMNEGLPRPIALRPPPVGGGGKAHSHLHSRLHSHGQSRCSPGGRPLQSPYHRRSAFTPTRPALVSPLGGSSDCSSPCSSPVPRPASVSSGYFESSTNSLVESSSLPDLGWTGSPTQRCRSQPTFDVGPPGCGASAGGGGVGGGGGGAGAGTGGGGGGGACQLRAGNKRRHRPVSLVWERDSAMGMTAVTAGPANVGLPASRKGQMPVAPPWPRPPAAPPGSAPGQVFYFGSSRSYLVGLPRILSSPSTGECSGHSSTVVDDEDSTAANSGSPESTHLASAESLAPAQGLDALGPVPPGGGRAGAAGGPFAAIAEAAEDSGCSDDDGEDDPPQIICSPNLDNVMLFRPVLPSTTIPQFQELDLDQIEND